MMSRHDCLNESLVRRFAGAHLPEEQAQAVEDHLRRCPRCAARVEKQFASLVEVLRASAQAERYPEQERIDRLILQLEGFGGGGAGEEEVSDEAPEVPESPDENPAEPPDAAVVLGPPVEADEIGRLGPYRVLERIGVGGVGTVYQAEDPLLRRRVAIKVLHRGARSERMRQRFLREAQALAALDHDHIVPIWQMGEHDGQPFLVMPLLRGETLAALLRRERRLPLPLVLQIARQTAEGLAVAHEAGLIHRDLKPDNLWLETRPEQTRVRILDFGLVADLLEEGRTLSCGAILGTPPYMAPEQTWGGPIDARADLFGLGCVLYECLAGHRAFTGQNRLAVLWTLANHELRPLRDPAPEAPRPVAELVMRLLARRPEDRPASAREVVRTLAALLLGRMKDEG